MSQQRFKRKFSDEERRACRRSWAQGTNLTDDIAASVEEERRATGVAKAAEKSKTPIVELHYTTTTSPLALMHLCMLRMALEQVVCSLEGMDMVLIRAFSSIDLNALLKDGAYIGAFYVMEMSGQLTWVAVAETAVMTRLLDKMR